MQLDIYALSSFLDVLGACWSYTLGACCTSSACLIFGVLDFYIYHIYDVCPPSGFISHYGCVRICMRWWPVYVWSYVCPYVMAIHLILYYDVYALSSVLVVLPWVLRSVARSEIFNLIDFRFWVQTENPMSDLFSDLVFSMFNWWWEEVLANWQWKSYK